MEYFQAIVIKLFATLSCFNLVGVNTDDIYHLEFWKPDPLFARRHDKTKATTITRKYNDNPIIPLIKNKSIPVESIRRTTAAEPLRKKKRGGKFKKIIPRKKPTLRDSPKLVKSVDANVGELIYLSPYSLVDQMQKVMSRYEHANFTTQVIGRTVEYKDIVLYKITEDKNHRFKFRAGDKYANDLPAKKIIFIVHGLSVMGIHLIPALSEWENFLELLDYYLEFLDKFDIFFIPMANPDGYLLSKSTQWNKNASPQAGCPGVSLDRNFNVMWNATNATNACSPLYPGPDAFSEPESRAVRDVFHYNSHKIVAYIHVHAGSWSTKTFRGDAILYPKGYADIEFDDDKYIDLNADVEEAINNASFKVMSVTVDTLYEWYGPVTGTSVDYASTVYGVPYAMEFVMQPYDSYYGENELALTEIWRRLIQVVLNNIWKNEQMGNSINKR